MNDIIDGKLLDAVSREDIVAIGELIKQGADIDMNEGAPLRYAIEYSSLKVISFLVECGANIENEENKILKCVKKHEVMKFFIEKGVDIDFNNSYWLRNRLYSGKLEDVKLLLESGANISNNNNRLLEIAIKSSNLEALKILIDFGVQINKLPKEMLELCASLRNGLEIVKYLITECDISTDIFLDNVFSDEMILDWVESYKKSKDLNEQLQKTLNINTQSVKKTKV